MDVVFTLIFSEVHILTGIPKNVCIEYSSGICLLDVEGLVSPERK